MVGHGATVLQTVYVQTLAKGSEFASGFVFRKQIIQADRYPLLPFLSANQLLRIVHNDADSAEGPHLLRMGYNQSYDDL